MAAGDTTVRNQGILVERVGREQCSHLSLGTGLGLEDAFQLLLLPWHLL